VLCLDYKYKFASHPKDLTRDQIDFLVAALAYRIEQITPEERGKTKIIITPDED
jgi:hypothetical protein